MNQTASGNFFQRLRDEFQRKLLLPAVLATSLIRREKEDYYAILLS
jgi:hypothetical protein